MAYSFIYDAEYDLEKDIWLEKGCSQEGCEYCGQRPEKPSQAKEL